MTSVLVLGGAGYIGSHMVDRLIENGESTIVVDNLCTGHLDAVNKKAKFYNGDISDENFMNKVFHENTDIDTVIHFAAYSLVAESMIKPLKYFDNNVIGLIKLLEIMKDRDIKNLVFSSTAATYGIPKSIPIKEDDVKNPINPYGESKLIMERIMKWADKAYGIKYVALRYFNVAGAKPDGSIGEDHIPETHLVPIILRVALGQQKELQIYGNDYDTSDGTNVRDYVHPLDLADAHILAMNYLRAGNSSNVFNLGSSTGFSNLQMLNAALKVTHKDIPYKISNRRIGDPDILVASSKKARKILGWNPKYDNVYSLIETAWNWHKNHPMGYNDRNNKKKV